MKATVIAPVARVIEPKKIVLELSVAEAHVIFALTGAVRGPRGISDGIHTGLQEALAVDYCRNVYGNYRAETNSLTLERTSNNYE